MRVLPICVNNQQHGLDPALNLSHASHVPALFSGFVHAVQAHEAAPQGVSPLVLALSPTVFSSGYKNQILVSCWVLNKKPTKTLFKDHDARALFLHKPLLGAVNRGVRHKFNVTGLTVQQHVVTLPDVFARRVSEGHYGYFN